MSEKIVTLGGRDVPVTISREGALHRVQSPGRSDTIEVIAIDDGEAELRVNGRRLVVPFLADGTSIQFAFDGEIYRAEVTSKSERRRTRHREHSMSAPMPGVVLKISVGVGDVVSRGAPLVVLEAMKMEHQIIAPHDGTVTAIHCSVGQLVQPGVDLISLDESKEVSG